VHNMVLPGSWEGIMHHPSLKVGEVARIQASRISAMPCLLNLQPVQCVLRFYFDGNHFD
jgi:hypothetical protein